MVYFVILKNIFKILPLLSPSIQIDKLRMCAGQNIECEWSKSRLYTGGNYSGNGTLVRPYSNFLHRLCAFSLALSVQLWATRCNLIFSGIFKWKNRYGSKTGICNYSFIWSWCSLLRRERQAFALANHDRGLSRVGRAFIPWFVLVLRCILFRTYYVNMSFYHSDSSVVKFYLINGQNAL